MRQRQRQAERQRLLLESGRSFKLSFSLLQPDLNFDHNYTHMRVRKRDRQRDRLLPESGRSFKLSFFFSLSAA